MAKERGYDVAGYSSHLVCFSVRVSFLTLPSLTSHSIFDPLRGCDVTGRERKAGARHSRVPFVPRVRSLLSGPCLATVSHSHSSPSPNLPLPTSDPRSGVPSGPCRTWRGRWGGWM